MFIWIPQLFARMPGGLIMMPLFFLALACAALSSLIAMIELATRILMDGGMPRRRAVHVVTAGVIVLGLPSAMSLSVLQNQDWVWGVGLMISGLFISLLVTMYGTQKFIDQYVNITPGGVKAGKVLIFLLKYLIPVEFAIMFAWWMYQAAVGDPAAWWDPLNRYSVGTCVVQWAVALIFLVGFNKRIAAASTRPLAEVSQ
jgi:NSS family neurotransmitter:Na+ symporter